MIGKIRTIHETNFKNWNIDLQELQIWVRKLSKHLELTTALRHIFEDKP